MGVARRTYNQAVAAINAKCGLSKQSLRGLIMKEREGQGWLACDADLNPVDDDDDAEAWLRCGDAENLEDCWVHRGATLPCRDQPEWVKAVPFNVRDEAVTDAIKAWKSSFALHKQKASAFRLGFRSRKDLQQSFVVRGARTGNKGDWFDRGSKVTNDGIRHLLQPSSWRQTCNRRKKRRRRDIPASLPSDARIIWDRRKNKWWLRYTVDDEESSESDKGVASIDPGVRTFATIYSVGQGGEAVTEFGAKDMARITRLCRHVDDLVSRENKKANEAGGGYLLKHRKRYRLRRARLRLTSKIKALVADLHWKTARWLLQHHQVVLLPKFDTQSMVGRRGRVIRSRTAREMCTWSHYTFRQRLLSKARAFPGCEVIICDEPYTSKTCGGCGLLCRGLGGSKVLSCKGCGVRIPRDANGARNILLRRLHVVRGAAESV